MKLMRAVGAELLGTAILTFVACGSDVIYVHAGHGIEIVARSVAPALTITALIWSLSGVSGAHLNPAVTFAFILRERFPTRTAALYIAGQFAGAVLACCLLFALFGDVHASVPHPAEGHTVLQAFLVEVVLSLFLMFVILSTTEQKAVVGKNDAIAVGGVIAACGFLGVTISGAAINPARAIGPMIVSGDLQFAWLYLAAPLVASVLASGVTWACLGSTRFAPWSK